jgi:hypothetical protein
MKPSLERRMKQVLLAGALGMAFSAFGALPAPAPAFACSAGPDYNPVAVSDVIFAGTITDWQRVEVPGTAAMFQPVRLTASVDHTFKGTAGPVLEAVDTASLIRHPGAGRQWAGSGGTCGAFDADPKGQFALMGLTRAEDGSLRTHLMQVFFIGERAQLSGERHARLTETLGFFGLVLPPSLGSAGLLPVEDGRGSAYLRPAGAVLAAGLIFFSIVWLASRRRTTP